jgi:hypothetical protein
MFFNKHVKCIDNKNKPILKINSIYTVILCVYMENVEFYKLKEIKNLLFESWRFMEVPKPGYSMSPFLGKSVDWKAQYHSEEIKKIA